MRRPASRAGFTLLEVIVALGILVVGLTVLIDTQATAVLMSTDMERMTTATMLAEEKMTEALLVLEQEGWTSQDIEEEGDFSDFGDEEFRGDALHLDLGAELEDFHWAYTVRAIDLTLPDDVWSMASQLADGGYWQEEKTENMDLSGAPDLGTLGITPDLVTEYLSNYIREVRVLVWWGDNEDGTDQVELVHHVINVSGKVTEVEDQG